MEKIVPRGFGLAFAEKLTVMVALAAPGDRLSVRLTEIKKRLAFAEILEVIEPGPDRVAPPCPYFGACGGCNFQQLGYQAQLASKLAILNDCLERISKIRVEREISIIPSPLQYTYRSRARWHMDPDLRQLGYYRRDSNDIIDVDICPVLTDGMQTALGTARSNPDWPLFFDDRPQIEAASDDVRLSFYSADIGDDPVELEFAAGGIGYRYSAQVFFQANRSLVPELVRLATAGLAGKTALDLYAGAGLFALPLARSYESVVAVEEHPTAARFARRNAHDNGFENVSTVVSSVRGYLRRSDTQRPDLVLIDPPRSGTEPGVIEHLSQLRPQTLVYVSCEPSILARDLRLLLDAGYQIEDITAVDLFPQTHHVETVVRLRI